MVRRLVRLSYALVVVFVIAAVAAGPAAEATSGLARGIEVLPRLPLDRPTGLAFGPRFQSLWIVNDAVVPKTVVVRQFGTRKQKAKEYFDLSRHFLIHPMAVAFSPLYLEFATAQDDLNVYASGESSLREFMGPTLWPADGRFHGDQVSHIDMVHHSPFSVGIAAGADPVRREYWVFNGESGSIDRYFFNQPHEPGAHDHLDGLTYRYAAHALAAVDKVPGSLAFDRRTGTLYIADTGNARIARLRPSGDLSAAVRIAGHHDETPLFELPGETVESVTSRDSGLVQPSGLALIGDRIVVSDHATGHVLIFRTDGTRVADLNTRVGKNALTGIAVGPRNDIYVLDGRKNRLLRIGLKTVLAAKP
jgi:hypothetical protein